MALVALLLVLAGGVLVMGTTPAAAHRCVSASRSPSAEAGDRPETPTIPAGKVGVPVRVSQPGLVRVVHDGDRVDLTAAGQGSSLAKVLARDVLVLGVTTIDSADLAGDSMIYLAMTDEQARRVAGTAPGVRIGVTVRPG
jgi:hypothetical protein